MKILSKLLLFCLASALVVPVQAAPSGPSAKSAARLKKRPTSKWLAHYLPDDRYKIAGGVWKYVSTDLDTYYHRPDSPLMMRQSASRVIGFASAAEALEAGYKPDPSLNGFGVADNVTVMGAGGTLRAARSARVARRVVLADGLSSVLLPAGWRTLPGMVQRAQFGLLTRDQLLGPRGERLVFETLVFSNVPSANIDMARIVNVEFFKNLKGNMQRFNATSLNRSGVVNSRISGQGAVNRINQLDNFNFFPVTVGGVKGVGVTMKRPVAGQPNREYVFGRGLKMWNIGDFSRGRQGSLTVLKGLKMR